MSPKPEIDQLYQAAYQKLLKVNRNYYLLNASRALLRLLAVAAAMLLGFALIDMAFDVAAPLRLGFWVLLGGLVLFFSIREIAPNLRRALRPAEADLYELSRRIGKNDPAVQDSLVNFLQIYHDRGIAVYPPFKNLSLKQLYEKFRHTNFYSIISLQILRKPANRLLIAATIFALLFIIFPASMSQAILKVLYPTQSFEKPLPVTLKNLSGNLTVLKNEALQLRGEYEGVTPHKLWLVIRNEAVPGDSAATERLELSGISGKSFSYEMNHAKTGFSYWFEARVEMATFQNRLARSEKGIVTVLERPFIRELKAKLVYPAYTRLPAAFLPPNSGEVTALRGTRVELEIEANKKLAKAAIWFRDAAASSQDSLSLPLAVAENRARGSFVVEKDTRYRIIIEDSDGISNYQPVTYSVFALSDESPYVEIARPGQDLDLGDELQLPLLLNLRDDYGFSKLLLKGRHVHAGSRGDTTEFALPLPYQALDPNRAISEYAWDLAPLYLIPEDYVEYFAEVWDNDAVAGPKSARSKSYILRLPSLTDILEQTEQAMNEQVEETRDVARDAKELKEKLQEINREMKREEELSWERKKEIQAQMERQQQALEKLEDIRKDIEDLANQLDNQNMISPETLEKFMELQQMFRDLASPELLEAMKKLQEALENANMEEMKEAMQQFQFSVEEFEQKIERTYELLKRVQLEQKMDELAKMAEKLAEEQKAINEQLQKENLSEAQREQLADKEANLEKDTGFFEEKLQQAKEEFQKEMAEIARELEKAQEFMDEQQLGQQMQQMEQQIRQGQMSQCRQSGQQLERQLEMLQSMMQQAQQNMNRMQKEELLQAMQKVQQDLLRSSFRQEQLFEKSDQADVASPQITDIARQQSQLRENSAQIIKELIDISKKTFFLSPQMSQTMSSLVQNMEESLASLENRNPKRAAQSQQRAMGDFNQAIMSMQNSMDQMMQSNSASGFEEFLQQMQQMAGQQGQLNQESMGLLQQQRQGKMQLSPDAMARLAAQQEMIRRSLENLNQQMGNRQDVPGRLGELGEEMEEVIEELKQQRLDRKVIERQERILSRLLDAQKSVREKEYSKKRQAEREDNVTAKSPPQLKQELLERENQLRKEMLEALKEGYSSEYKEFIKSYYEILSRQPNRD